MNQYIYEEFLMEIHFISALTLFAAPFLIAELVEKLKNNTRLQTKSTTVIKEINHRKAS
ncbi:MAG: hypothetical protein KH321_03110 [Clostridium sp.]|jgi:hypothetical protein|nr:hypothetical protein [Clostridium sp.]